MYSETRQSRDQRRLKEERRQRRERGRMKDERWMMKASMEAGCKEESGKWMLEQGANDKG
jgi:hypothetical protein